MGRSESGRVRSGKPAKEFSSRSRRRSRICRCNLFALQRRLLEGIAVRNRRLLPAHRLRCRCTHQRGHRRRLDHFRHGYLRSGLDEFLRPQWSARRLRHGPRWNFFQDRRGHPSEIPHARALAALSRRTGKFDGVDGNIRRVDQSFYFCCMDLLCFRRCRALSHAQNRTRFAAPLSLLGLSLGPRPLRRRRACSHLQYLARAPRPLLHWLAPDPRRPPLLSSLEPVALSCWQFAGELIAAKEGIASASRPPEERLQETTPSQAVP